MSKVTRLPPRQPPPKPKTPPPRAAIEAGERLRKVRLRVAAERGWGDRVVDAAKALGINANAWHAAENGHRPLSKKSLPVWAAKLGVSVDELLTGRAKMPGKSVRVVGFVGESKVVLKANPSDDQDVSINDVEVPGTQEDLQALIVTTALSVSGSHLRKGAILYFNPKPGRTLLATLEGDLCVVLLPSGERRVVVLTSQPDGSYLEWQQSFEAPRVGVRYEAVWPITWIKQRP